VALVAPTTRADHPAARPARQHRRSEIHGWITEEAPRVDRPEVVFDIDEAALSNWEVIKANDFGRVIDGPCNKLPDGPCGWRDWDLRAQSTVIQPTVDVFTTAKDRGALIMEPPGAHYVSAADFKAPQREQIEQRGYTIIANIGEKPSDLDEIVGRIEQPEGRGHHPPSACRLNSRRMLRW
jgi:hypothetical protein